MKIGFYLDKKVWNLKSFNEYIFPKTSVGVLCVKNITEILQTFICY